jgi:23S rRNA (cytidine1920-2'-O)/16S rRNA (cytidine1409-2'-O)-methyltransferase
MKQRLDRYLVDQKLVSTRSQAESYIKLGQVKVNGKLIDKPGYFVSGDSKIDFEVFLLFETRRH